MSLFIYTTNDLNESNLPELKMIEHCNTLPRVKGSTICASVIVERFNNNLLKYNCITPYVRI